MLKGFKDPQVAAQLIVDWIDTLSEIKRVPYLPDEPDPVVGLYDRNLLLLWFKNNGRFCLLRINETLGLSDVAILGFQFI